MSDDVTRYIDSEEFYNDMQAYRHSPLFPQQPVCAAYENVKEKVRADFAALQQQLDDAKTDAHKWKPTMAVQTA